MFQTVARAVRTAAPQLPMRAAAPFHVARRMAHGVAQPAAARIPVTFVSMDGQRWQTEGVQGETLLDTIRRADVPVPGMCNGGGLGPERFSDGPMCRTCHVYVDVQHLSKLPPKGKDEEELTDFIPNKTQNSRFACEIIVEPSLSGMIVVIPDYPERP